MEHSPITADNSAEAIASARAALRDRLPQQALTIALQALQAEPQHAELEQLHAMALLALDRPQEALQCLEPLLARRGDLAYARYLEGQALRRLKRPDAAINALREALIRRPDFEPALKLLGATLDNLGRGNEAAAARKAFAHFAATHPSQLRGWVAARAATAEPGTTASLRDSYLGLMRKVLCNVIYGDPPLRTDQAETFDATLRASGKDWPSVAHTMIGMRRLEQLQHACESALREGIAGDFVETGVWRGGACILMRAVLHAWGERQRCVWAVDSFAGLPPPDSRHPADFYSPYPFSTMRELAVTREQVQQNFRVYDLLDEQVCFLEGFFCDTLPQAPIAAIAVLRLDGDMYSSTMDVLDNLYDRVSPGGFVIVDDYGEILECRRAVHDFRERRAIADEIFDIDGAGACWRKSSAAGH